MKWWRQCTRIIKLFAVLCKVFINIVQKRLCFASDNCLSDRISHDVNFFVEFGRKLDVIRDINSTSRPTSPGPFYNTIATREMIPQPLQNTMVTVTRETVSSQHILQQTLPPPYQGQSKIGIKRQRLIWNSHVLKVEKGLPPCPPSIFFSFSLHLSAKYYAKL